MSEGRKGTQTPLAEATRDIVLRNIRERRSVRAFLDQPVERELVETVLEVARWAPSGANTQPWDVRVVTGDTKARITKALLEAREKGVPEHPDYQYYPVEWFEPYKTRRMGLGVAMYSTQGARRNRAESWNNNYRFFGAPVGLLFFIHKDLAKGSWMDYGMFIQNVMLAARALGLETCCQASISDYPDEIREILGIGPERLLACAMSLGYPDWSAPINGFARNRAPVSEFAVFYD